MRIAWIIDGPLEQKTGGYLYDQEIIKGLRGLGHEVVVVSLPAVGLATRFRAFDICVGDELCFRDLGPLFEALAGGPRRLLLVHHLSRWGGSKDHAAEQRVLDAADLWVATSTATARRLAEEGVRAGGSVVEPGADRLLRHAGDGRKACATEGPLLFIGSVVPHKGLHTLLAAFDSAAAPQTRLQIVGDERRDPNCAASLRNQVARSPRLSAAVEFKGPLDDDALADSIVRASALVLPSLLEGYGMVLTEAVSLGTPVICTTACPAGLTLQMKGAALVVQSGDVTALAEALGTFTSDASLRLRMTNAAAALAPHLPTWADAVAAFETVLLSPELLGPDQRR